MPNFWPPKPIGRPAEYKPYKFKKIRRITDLPKPIRPTPILDDENLTGFVRGYNATDIEERFARALIDIDIGFWFQYNLETLVSGPVYDKRLDFLVFWMPGKIVPVEIYGDRWHSNSSDRVRDNKREIEINEVGKIYGWEKLIVVWGHELYNQIAANNKARELFI